MKNKIQIATLSILLALVSIAMQAQPVGNKKDVKISETTMSRGPKALMNNLAERPLSPPEKQTAVKNFSEAALECHEKQKITKNSAHGGFMADKKTNYIHEKLETYDKLATEYFSQIMGIALSASSNLKLYQFVYDWIGTPYRLGGDSKKGIDCSKFAFELYNKVFNTMIANNSKNIFGMVSPVNNKDELKEGDLIFFKIRSRSITHVGVYIGNNKFVHASSSRGVMISNLDEDYWTKYYYKGGRLLGSFQ